MTATRQPGASRPRHRPKRKITLALALLLVLAAALVGAVVGWTAGARHSSTPTVTLERDVPVVTVTGP